MMKIQLRFFAGVREALGIAQESIIVPEHVSTAGQVRDFLIARGGVWAEVLAEGRAVRMAYDHEMTGADTKLVDGGELAFFPPVTGG